MAPSCLHQAGLSGLPLSGEGGEFSLNYRMILDSYPRKSYKLALVKFSPDLVNGAAYYNTL